MTYYTAMKVPVEIEAKRECILCHFEIKHTVTRHNNLLKEGKVPAQARIEEGNAS